MSARTPPPIQSPHLLYRASAGSGKTFQLTNEMLRRILAGEDAGNLLATTFTRAAAAEILHRALLRLSEGALDEKPLQELRDFIDPDLTHAGCAGALERVVGDLHRLSVLTIDAFFARLASSFSLELGLAPGWRMIDEAEDARLRAEAADLALRASSGKEMLEILRDLQGDRIRTDAHKAIMQVVEEAYGVYLDTQADERVWSVIQPAGRLLTDDGMRLALRALEDFDFPLTKSGSPRANWVKNLDKAREAASKGDWWAFADLTLVQRILGGHAEFDRAEIEPRHVDALQPLIEHARMSLTTEHVAGTRAMLQLLRRFDDAYRGLKRSLGGLTFDDAPRLLTNAATTGDLEQMFYRLDARLHRVLLDEFQDTSMSQFRLLEPILDELLSQAEPGRSVFCVGDAKQSLYAWRDAEPTLLPSMKSRWPSFHEQALAKSYRSSQVVLEAVNAIFSNTAANPAFESDLGAQRAAREWDSRFDLHESAKPRLAGFVRLTVAGDAEEAEEDEGPARAAVMQAAARRVLEAHRAAPGATIAVLVRSGRDIATVLGLLKAAGLDASEQRGNPLVDTPAVAAAMSLLRYIEHPSHTAGLHHASTTPLGSVVGLADPRDETAGGQVAARLRRRIAEQGVAPVLAAWREACIGSMDARSAQRFDQLVDLAEGWDESSRGGAADFADSIDARRVDEPGRAPVRVMTIHGSKGLEFDVVALPLYSAKAWRVTAGAIGVRDEPLGPITRVTRYPNTTMRLLHDDLRAMHEQAMQRQVNEELCCLYVATTRAKRCLELIVPPDSEKSRGAALVGDAWKLKPEHLVRHALAREAPAVPGATLWTHGDERAWAAAPELREGRQSAPAHQVSLSVRPARERSALRLAGATPSRERGRRTIDAASLLAHRDPRGRIIGDLVHRWFEQIEWIEDGAPSEASLRACDAARAADAETVERALGAFRSGLAGESVRAALSRKVFLAHAAGATDAVVHRERPFAIRDGDRLLEGRFDRLVVAVSDGRPVRAEVVDFKTDHAARDLIGDALREHAESHRPQMEAYRRAAARLLCLEDVRVGMTLLFTSAGEAVRLV